MDFLVLVEEARIVEQFEVDPSRVIKTQKHNFSNGKLHKRSYDKLQQSTPGHVKCFECSGVDYKCDFPKLVYVKIEEGRCRICNNPRHFANTCVEKKS